MNAARDQAINIRATRPERDLIDQAAQTLGKSRSEFMLETLHREATQVILDRVFFQLDETRFDQFADMVDHPQPPSSELRRLLTRKSPWE
ncbi:MAG: DUF1778 domain-containing protein [Thermomicrobiales bacterium]